MIRRISLVIFSLLIVIAAAAECRAGGARLDDAADQIVSHLAERFPVAGNIIQLTPDSLTMIPSGRVLGFSRAFCQHLSAAFSERGARVSVHEQGEAPLIISGQYDLLAKNVEVTVRLRRMGKEASTDLAIARVSIDVEDVALHLLEDNLSIIVKGLLAELEQETALLSDAHFEAGPGLPLHSGKPTLRMGAYLQEAVAEAMSASEMFGGTHLVQVPVSFHLIPRYEVQSDEVILRIELVDGDGDVTAQSSTALSLQLFPSDSLELYDNRNLGLCVSVEGGGRGAIKQGSRRGRELVGYVSDIFNKKYGLELHRCNNEPSQRTMSLQLRTTNKRTPDGFSLLQGDLSVQVLDSGGRVSGQLSSSGHVRSTAGSSQLGPLNKVLFDDALVAEIARLILIYDH